MSGVAVLDETNTLARFSGENRVASRGASESVLSIEEAGSETLPATSEGEEGLVHGRGRVKGEGDIITVTSKSFFVLARVIVPGASIESTTGARVLARFASGNDALAEGVEGAGGISFAGFLRGVGSAAGGRAGTDERSGDVGVPLAAGVEIAILLGLVRGASSLLAAGTSPRAAELGTVHAITGLVEFRAGVLKNNRTSPHVHSRVVHTIVHTTVFTDVSLDTILVTTVVPEGDVFVLRRNVSGVVGVSGGGILRLEAAPGVVGGFDITGSGISALVHRSTGPSNGVVFRTSHPAPLGEGIRGGGVSGETDPQRLVGLGGDEGVLLEGGDGGEVALHAEELDLVAGVDGFSVAVGDVDEAVEVAGQVVVVGEATEGPRDAAGLEVISGGVEDDSRDGVEVLRHGGGTREEEGTLDIIPVLRDVEGTLIVKEEFVAALGVVDLDGDGGTVNFLIVWDFEVGERVDAEVSLHGDVL